MNKLLIKLIVLFMVLSVVSPLQLVFAEMTGNQYKIVEDSIVGVGINEDLVQDNNFENKESEFSLRNMGLVIQSLPDNILLIALSLLIFVFIFIFFKFYRVKFKK